ncbi:hypothetical protein NDU88_007421 [Pleurodeles waltl]|uniref:Uncharacterized protein n=1 Tax=Pleurodeles waltl TaxID=8319 RepID=A0AAV7LTK9_PLEWA|nr:hypothetical protein NDU88_007421 [Pleurodeles waltl]
MRGSVRKDSTKGGALRRYAGVCKKDSPMGGLRGAMRGSVRKDSPKGGLRGAMRGSERRTAPREGFEALWGVCEQEGPTGAALRRYAGVSPGAAPLAPAAGELGFLTLGTECRAGWERGGGACAGRAAAAILERCPKRARGGGTGSEAANGRQGVPGYWEGLLCLQCAIKRRIRLTTMEDIYLLI